MVNLSSDSDDDLDFDEDEFLYEYLERKPIVKFFYSLTVTIACIFGLIANSIVIYMKMRNFRNRTTFDLLTCNVALGMNFLALRFILIMIEETTHDFISISMCYAARVTVDIGTPLIITSLIVIMILIKYQPNLSKEMELKIVAAMWIYSMLIALPVYQMFVIEHNSWKTPHNVCLLHFKNDRNHTKYLIRLWISVTLKIFMPLAVAIVFFISLRFNFRIGQHKNLWLYSIFLSVYYFGFSISSIITPLIGIHFNVSVGTRMLVYVSFNMLCFIVAISPIILCYLDRDFYQETIDFLKLKLRRGRDDNDDFNEIVFNEKDLQDVVLA